MLCWPDNSTCIGSVISQALVAVGGLGIDCTEKAQMTLSMHTLHVLLCEHALVSHTCLVYTHCIGSTTTRRIWLHQNLWTAEQDQSSATSLAHHLFSGCSEKNSMGVSVTRSCILHKMLACLLTTCWQLANEGIMRVLHCKHWPSHGLCLMDCKLLHGLEATDSLV